MFMYRTVLLAVLCCIPAFLPETSEAAAAPHGLEWNVKKQLSLEATPLDVASAPDGKFIYVLAPGEVIVYSGADDKVIKRIPVDKSFDRMTLSLLDNTLVLTSSTEKQMKLIELEVVHAFDLSGLAHKGPANAPVVLVVFSDYQ